MSIYTATLVKLVSGHFPRVLIYASTRNEMPAKKFLKERTMFVNNAQRPSLDQISSMFI